VGSMNYTTALVAFGASTALALGCTRSTPASQSATADAARPFTVFTDTAVYRRHCVVPAGRPVDLTQPCFLLDQGRTTRVRLPVLRP
jgi:hypothetical protein